MDTLLYPILFFASSPWFIDKLGEKEFGIWILVNSIIITMQLFNLGLGTAIFKNVAVHAGLSDNEKVIKTINTNFSLSFILHLVCILAGGIIAISIKKFSLFNIESSYTQLASLGALFGGFIVGLKFYEQLIGYTFKALERFDLAAWINSGIRLTTLFINIILVYLGYGLISLFICTITVSMIGIVTGLLLIRRKVPDYFLSFHFNKESITKELNFAVWPWLQSLAIVITFQCDRFFVLTYIGLSTLTYYGLVATMFNHIHMGFSALVPWLAPKTTRLKTQGIDSKELYMTSRNLCLVIALSALLVFSLVSAPLLKMLISLDKYNHTIKYFKLFTLFELFFVYTIVPNNYLNAGGYEKLNFGIVLFYCVIIITGMLVGYKIYNTAAGILTGLVIATALSVFVQQLIVSRKVFTENGWISTLVLFFPAMLISACVITDTLVLKLALVIASLISLYLVFGKYNRINLNLVNHG
jgi:O-antigen/teichoic acid export membrane protein